MITPKQIHRKAQKLWNSGRILKAALTQAPLFPWAITFRKPTAQQQVNNFAAVRQWMSHLKSYSKATSSTQVSKGGYEIEYKTLNHRQLGMQQLPTKILFQTENDLLRYLGKLRLFTTLLEMAQESRARFPLLKDWLANNPRLLMKHVAIWEKLLTVCDYFIENPRPDCYLRELDITGIDTKFIETHKAILSELLTKLLAVDVIDQQVTSLTQHGFERRYGLKFEQPLIRLRLLDKSLYPIATVSDISLPLSQLAQWEIPCQRLFITENKVNGLSFPAMENSVVIFGLGYGINQLATIPWLSCCEIYYWGDIDTYGFSILSRLRYHYPKVHSLMMDEATLQQHIHLCVTEPINSRCAHQLQRLNTAEQQLYLQLQQNHYRLEQERLPMQYIKQQLNNS